MNARGSLSALIFLVEEAPEGSFTARALGESIFTEADDIARGHATRAERGKGRPKVH